ncbi:MAG TPA: VOC family protein [Rhodoglobus sp.]|jgi:catechol 2,3-dioxygenase-like lactoylglutathione lyase family enzyme|nr:VOC family protein [Actinomycetota bacterium]HOB58164.1 VOC family protein [Rhodoglobus sp.]HOT34206.1 VOC family protein [Rhodoglobus sp.]HOW00338.1 VOC family protein [Rhodoglobus sp.]HOY81294.1 VOC family protein [Rhodoglobus sp.]
MLQDLYTVLPAQDLERARGFYHDKLGMEPEGTLDGMLMYRVGPAGRFALYETSNAGTAQNTQMCLISDDLAADMARLRDAGLAFEEYDFPGMKTVDGVLDSGESRTAWFRDSEGNFVCLSQLA